LIDESTKRYLGDRFVLDRIGEVSVKGKEQTLMVYRVIGHAGEETAAHSEAPRAPAR
jgi:class 3 adenylate cyclase